MPTYAYACTACGHRFEVQQAFSASSLTQCPECEGKLRKLFNTVGIVFKGSGFYRTDSRKSASTAAPAASSSTSDSGSSNGSADKAADKKSEPAKSSSASEKVA